MPSIDIDLSSPLYRFALLSLVLLVVLFLIGKLTLGKAAPPLRRGWTCGVVGLRGGGKSLFVMRLVAARLQKGHNVVANFSIDPTTVSGNGTAVRASSWTDFAMAPPGSTIVIDEAHQWFPAQAGRTIDAEANWYMSHSRKLGHEVWWIAQHESQVAGRIGGLTNEYVLCQAVAFGRHRATSYAPHVFRKKDAKKIWSWWYRPKGAATRVYDTLELIAPEGKNDPEGHIAHWIESINAERVRVAPASAAGRSQTASIT